MYVFLNCRPSHFYVYTWTLHILVCADLPLHTGHCSEGSCTPCSPPSYSWQFSCSTADTGAWTWSRVLRWWKNEQILNIKLHFITSNVRWLPEHKFKWLDISGGNKEMTLGVRAENSDRKATFSRPEFWLWNNLNRVKFLSINQFATCIVKTFLCLLRCWGHAQICLQKPHFTRESDFIPHMKQVTIFLKQNYKRFITDIFHANDCLFWFI